MQRIATILIGTLLTVGAPALAGSRAGVTMPDTITVAGSTLTLNGMGVREATWLNVDVYVAGLYVEHPSSNAAQLVRSADTKVLILRFKRSVGRDDITKAWSEGFAKNATVPVERLRPWITTLNAWMPKFAKGDTLTFTLVRGKGVTVDINGTRKGTIGDDEFARSLLSIWLGARPPNQGLKTGLLGRHGGA